MDTKNTVEIEAAPKKKKSGFHPKRFLKGLQQKLYTSPSLYLLFCFIVPMALMFLIYVCNGTYPFGKNSALVLDLNAQYVHFFTALRQWVYGDGSLLYSFYRSLGGEFMGIYAYYLASPFTYIVALFPLKHIQEAVLCILVLKTGFCGLTMGYYLHKRSKNPNKLVVLIFALLYSLCSFSVIQQNNTMWIDAMILLPIFLYALENLIVNKRYKLYVITLATLLITNYYIGYMMCIFAVLYFFYYYFSKSKNEINPNGEKLHFLRAGVRFALFSILAAAISAFMLIVAYYSLGFGKSEFSNPNWGLNGNFAILDFLVKFLPGSFDTVEPAGLPFVYCGLITLFLVPVYFVTKKIPVREKVSAAALVTVLLLSLIVSPIDLIWHGFSTPNWLNARYSFMLCFVLLILAYKGFAHLRRVGEKFILGFGALLVLLVAFAEKSKFTSFINSKEKLLVFGCIWFSVFFIVALIALLCLRIRVKRPMAAKSVSAVMAAIICVELVCNGVVCFMQFDADVAFATYEKFDSFFGELRPVTEKIKEYDTGFYRMEKTTHYSKNDNMSLGINGISNSTSTLNASAIEFVGQLGYTGRSHLTMYKGGTPLSDSLLGIKYVIDSKSSSRFSHTYTVVSEIDDNYYKVVKNPYAMSLAYVVDKDVQNLALDEYSGYFTRTNGIISAMLGEHETLEIFNSVSGMTTTSSSCTVTETTASIKCQTADDAKGTVMFSYVAPYTGDYYFYSPTKNSAKIKNLSAKIYTTKNEENAHREQLGTSVKFLDSDSTHILWAGYHEKGSIIEVELTIPEKTKFELNKSVPFLWYLDSDAYNSAMTTLTSNPQLKIDEDIKEHNITGSIATTAPAQMVFTTIPYDEGWSVYVDGQKVETYQTMDALMAFDIDGAGAHSVEMKYMPSCYILGAIISAFGILAFVAICVLEMILKKTLLKNKAVAYVHEYWILDDLEEDRQISGIDFEQKALEYTKLEAVDDKETVIDQAENDEVGENNEEASDTQNT